MAKKEYKQLIDYRVNFINKKLGTNYETNYAPQYGGWNMSEVKEGGKTYRGNLGFDLRKSNAEMLAYVDGIYELLCHYQVAV